MRAGRIAPNPAWGVPLGGAFAGAAEVRSPSLGWSQGTAERRLWRSTAVLSWPAKPADGWDMGASRLFCTPGPVWTPASIRGAAATRARHAPQPTGGNSHLGHGEPGGLGGSRVCFQPPIPFPPQLIPPPGQEQGQLLEFEIQLRGLGPAPVLRAEGWVPVWGCAAPVWLGGCLPMTPVCWVGVVLQAHLFRCILGFLS